MDDRWLTIGSANLANRSMGLDTECNLVIEAVDERQRAAIRRARDTLLAEHLEVEPAAVRDSIATQGSLLAAIEALGHERSRLEALPPAQANPLAELGLPTDLADPPEPLTLSYMDAQLLPQRRRPHMRSLMLRVGLLLLVLIGIAAAVHLDLVPAAEFAQWLLDHAQANRTSPIGGAAVLLAFVVGSLLFVPVTLLIALTATAFGALVGFGYALTGSIAAACATFLLGRLLGQELIQRVGGRYVARINRRLARRGTLAMAVVRMVPVAPFTLVNLAAGATEIRWRDFVLGTILGMLPGVALMTLVGDRLGAWLRQPDPLTLAMVGAAALAAFMVAVALKRWRQPEQDQTA